MSVTRCGERGLHIYFSNTQSLIQMAEVSRRISKQNVADRAQRGTLEGLNNVFEPAGRYTILRHIIIYCFLPKPI